MNRLPEAEIMDDTAQAKAYAAADFSAPHERFVSLLKECYGETAKGVALDIGCGAADVIWRCAREFPDVEIHGVDGSGAMLQRGRENLLKHGIKNRVRLIEGYLPGVKLPRSVYDIVISNSLLHHLKDPALLWRLVKAYAKPGGFAFVMDLLRPEDEATARTMVAQYATGEADILKRDFYNSLLSAYTLGEVTAQIRASRLNLKAKAVSDRHFVAWGRV